MEAHIVVRGRVGIKAPLLVSNVSMQTLIDRYEDVLWEKTVGGDKLRQQVDEVITKRLEPDSEASYDVWMFDQVKEVGPTQIFGEVVLI